jgi:iron complex transport system ATP-binding protein
MLLARDLGFGFPGRRVGSGVSLSLDEGRTLAVLGGNGAGKTTLLRSLLGLLPPQAGSVTLDGVAVDRLGPIERARRMAYVPQQHAPPFAYTVEDMELMGRAARMSAFGRPGVADRAAALGALARLGIEGLRARAVNELSGGERQLVLIARALAQQAPLLVLDEPTASLDFGNRARVLDELDRLRASGLSIIFSTHEPEQALAHADQALLLAEGRPLACDTALQALTAANVTRLYGVAVERVTLGRRQLFVATGQSEASRAIMR